MVDPDVLRRKTEQVLHHAARLRARSDLSASTFAADEDLRNTVLMDLQQAIQACIDLAAHACVDDELGLPTGPAGAFALLARAGRIADDLSIRLAAAAGLRNIIVHQYGEIDAELILEAVREHLDDLLAFVQSFGTVPRHSD